MSFTLWQTLLIAGGVSLTAAIGTHFIVGYTDGWHLAPPVAALTSLVLGLTLSYPLPYGAKAAVREVDP